MGLNVKMLSEIKSGDDIVFLSPAVNPGYHCPLYGVVMCEKYISDLAVLILGERECCWNAYNQHLGNMSSAKFYTYTMDDMDIIYGVESGLCRAVRESWEKDNFKALMLVSSCVPELTGEDLEKLAAACDIPVPVLFAHTSHYNSRGYFNGITNYYNGLFPLIKAPVNNGRDAAVLGSRYDNIEKSEVPLSLEKAGKKVFVPSCIKDIEELSSVKLNLVADVTALELAQKIEDSFGVPYVRIDRLCNPDTILSAYRKMDEILGTRLAEEYKDTCSTLKSRIKKLRNYWQGKGFVCAAPFCLPFETAEFFCDLGMHPDWIVLRDIYPGEEKKMENLLKAGNDCPVSPFASLGNLEKLYRKINADLYFGFISTMNQPEGSLLINPAPCGSMTGFSFPDWILSSMERSTKGAGHGT